MQVVTSFSEHCGYDSDNEHSAADSSSAEDDEDADMKDEKRSTKPKKGSAAAAAAVLKQLKALPHHDEPGVVHSLVVSACGRWLASADHFNRIHVYNLQTMQVCCVFKR